jgi:hypothetical protein
MARKKKAALNQNPVIEPIKEEIEKTPIEEPTITVHGTDFVAKMEELHNVDINEEIKEMVSNEKEVEVETELPKVEFVNEPISIEIPENWEEPKKEEEVQQFTITKPSQAQLAKLSKAGLRWYQRTGMLPK